MSCCKNGPGFETLGTNNRQGNRQTVQTGTGTWPEHDWACPGFNSFAEMSSLMGECGIVEFAGLSSESLELGFT